MPRKLKVLFVTAECIPYGTTGGLGEVSSDLPYALSEENVSILRVLPLYRQVDAPLKYVTDFSVPMKNYSQTCIVKADVSDKKVATYFIGNDFYYNKDNMYGYYEDGERFLFFCKAVIEMLNNISFKPDIIHCNDWHTGFIPFILKAKEMDIPTIYTIHNLKYSGYIGVEYLREFNLPIGELYSHIYPEALDFTRAALIYSNVITTVSREYAREIQTKEYGEGYDHILRAREKAITGIGNGINYEHYNPIQASVPFDLNSLEGKAENKKLLKEELGLKEEDIPLLASVSRLDPQKGIDLIINMIRQTDLAYFQLIILGTGNEEYVRELTEIEKAYTGRMRFIHDFDSELASKIYAASDMFLMPSRFEACGIGQLAAMAYGTIPIMRNVGGLKSTAEDLPKGCFIFDEYSVKAFTKAIEKAMKAYNTPRWGKMMKTCLSYDRSWKNVVNDYIQVYHDLLKVKKI
ncbi:MAG: glycogen synthase [Clostridiales bacterium]|nr:glycogen synthase [Clostridiales bacterium]